MSEWPVVKLGEVLRHVPRPVNVQFDGMYREIGIRSHGKGLFHKAPISGVELGDKRVFFVEPGDFVLNIVFAWEGAVGLVSDAERDMTASHRFPTFRSDEQRLDLRFLLLFFRTPTGVESLGRVSPGGAGRNRTLNRTAFLALEIPLPPLPEQQRLVARVDAVTKLLDRGLRLNSQSVAEANALARAGRDAVYVQFAARYGVVDVASLCKSITDGDHNTPAFSEEGVPFMFVGNVSTGKLHFEGSKRVHPEYFARLSTSRVPKRGDVLFSAVGASLGVPAVVDTDTGFCFQRHIAILKPDHDRVVPQFLWHMLMSRTCFDMTWSSTTGSAQPTIPLHAIRALKIPQPPLDEQHGIVAELDALQAEVDALKAAQAASRAELDALLPAILDHAFAGAL